MYRLPLFLLSVLLTATVRGQNVIDNDASLIALARSAVVAEVRGNAVERRLPTPTPSAVGVFVTIERHGQVIGCRGTLTPQGTCLADEVVAAARSAAGHDPRYAPLTARDLGDFLVTVTIVERLETIAAGQITDLSPGEGLVLTSGDRTGVVLPWEGRYPALRLRWAYKKAGIAESSPCTLRRMIARRFRG